MTTSTTSTLPTYRYFWRLIRYSALYFITDISTATVYWLSHTVIGLIMRAFFNYLTGEEGFALPLGPVIALQISYAIVASIALASAIYFNTAFRYRSMALMIRNLSARLLEMPGSTPLPIGDDGKRMSSGQVVSTYRDDTNEMITAITVIEDSMGMGITAAISLSIMVAIDPIVTLGTFIPLAFIVYISYRLGPRIKAYRKASRESTSLVTGMIADMFNGAQAIKVANAEDNIVNHFRKLNDQRRQTMVRDRLLTELINSLSQGSIDIGMGFILLFASQSLYNGDLTIGDFALFAAYLWPMTHFFRMVGYVFTFYRQSGVSLARMEKMMQGAPPGGPTEHQPIYLSGPYPAIPQISKNKEDYFENLRVEDLTFTFDGETQPAIQKINFQLDPGTLTVIIGRVGSGKTTLLKTMLGLLPKDRGEVYWNQVPIEDEANFLIPPRCAYIGQVPRLLSDTILNNIMLGLSRENFDLENALHTAVLEEDLKTMENRLETMIGPRGMRLSGGQIQRTAAARMFVRKAEVLVLDDLSSALDVETEAALWDRLFNQKGVGYHPTYLVVSHRRPVLRQADQIIVLKNGTISDRGRLQDLLETSAEMQFLWEGEHRANEVNGL